MTIKDISQDTLHYRPSLVHMSTTVKICPINRLEIFVHSFGFIAFVITADNLPRFETEILRRYYADYCVDTTEILRGLLQKTLVSTNSLLQEFNEIGRHSIMDRGLDRCFARPFKNKRISYERVEKFISPLYFSDVNLYSR